MGCHMDAVQLAASTMRVPWQQRVAATADADNWVREQVILCKQKRPHTGKHTHICMHIHRPNFTPQHMLVGWMAPWCAQRAINAVLAAPPHVVRCGVKADGQLCCTRSP
jgi:hypothetical protein